ncbi:MAG TPA: hypothetical protein VMG12_06605 [Polyangiaceae bacterium]|nr:hypothetical protein [Polyangiaceae bacterium]
MPSLVLRVWVLFLAVLFQASSWYTDAYSSVGGVNERWGATAPLVADDGERDCDAPEDSSQELSAVDDAFGSDVVPANVSDWSTPLASAGGYAWVDGLPPGGHPAETPFKPPRA